MLGQMQVSRRVKTGGGAATPARKSPKFPSAKQRKVHKRVYRAQESTNNTPDCKDTIVVATDAGQVHPQAHPDHGHDLKKYPHLDLTQPLKWTVDELGARRPVAPKDDIEKVLFMNTRRPGFKWVGKWAEDKLQREITKYEAVKRFWLFGDCSGKGSYRKGQHNKHRFLARVFQAEMDSPWVQAWLSKLISQHEVDTIMEWHRKDRQTPKPNVKSTSG